MAARRLIRELRDARKSEDALIRLDADETDLMRWRAFVRGPGDTPYAGGVFELRIDVPEAYPMVPPRISFVTPVFHPNVLWRTGEICLDILKSNWTPTWDLQGACRAIQALLADPAADSPLNCDAGNLVRHGDLLGFESMARMYTAEHAMRSMPARA